jgi:hypothetical protein
MYLPQFVKENSVFVELVAKHFNPDVIRQYQAEERSVIVRRIRSQRHRMKDLRDSLLEDDISTPEKTRELAVELAAHHEDPHFLQCKTMSEILSHHVRDLIFPIVKG